MLISLQGFCIDSSSTFVFAAGEDNRVRAWSLKTGDIVLSPIVQGYGEQVSGRTQHLLALKEFSRPVNALVLSDSEDLWVASGRDVFCFENILHTF